MTAVGGGRIRGPAERIISLRAATVAGNSSVWNWATTVKRGSQTNKVTGDCSFTPREIFTYGSNELGGDYSDTGSATLIRFWGKEKFQTWLYITGQVSALGSTQDGGGLADLDVRLRIRLTREDPAG